jgi:hypothetical protein
MLAISGKPSVWNKLKPWPGSGDVLSPEEHDGVVARPLLIPAMEVLNLGLWAGTELRPTNSEGTTSWGAC